MKAYLDSTNSRRLAWNKAFPDVYDIFGNSNEFPSETTHIFLHETDVLPLKNDADYLRELTVKLEEGRGLKGEGKVVAANRAVALRARLKMIKNHAIQPPWLILYSGADYLKNREETVKQNLSVLLDGYYLDRIRVIEKKIDRSFNDEALLRNLINSYVDGLLKSPLNPNFVLAQKRLQLEGTYAMRLLCEAWDVNFVKNHSDITIHVPTEPEDWFRPFGKKVDEAAVKDIVENMILPHTQNEVNIFLNKIASSKTVLKDDLPRLKQALDEAIKSAAT